MGIEKNSGISSTHKGNTTSENITFFVGVFLDENNRVGRAGFVTVLEGSRWVVEGGQDVVRAGEEVSVVVGGGGRESVDVIEESLHFVKFKFSFFGGENFGEGDTFFREGVAGTNTNEGITGVNFVFKKVSDCFGEGDGEVIDFGAEEGKEVGEFCASDVFGSIGRG